MNDRLARQRLTEAAAEARAAALGHELARWHRVGARMDATLCRRCSLVVYVAIRARTGEVVAGGPALEGPCPGEDQRAELQSTGLAMAVHNSMRQHFGNSP